MAKFHSLHKLFQEEIEAATQRCADNLAKDFFVNPVITISTKDVTNFSFRKEKKMGETYVEETEEVVEERFPWTVSDSKSCLSATQSFKDNTVKFSHGGGHIKMTKAEWKVYKARIDELYEVLE